MNRTVSTVLLFLLCYPIFSPAAAGQTDSTFAMLEEITAFVQIDENLATSGQIAYDQIPLLKDAGYEVVINLAPADDERNAEEGFLVTQQGLTYIQIPVSWQDPSERDLKLFFDVMKANRDRKVFVHCFANMRVSAFVYLYRTLHEGIPEETARADLAKIWDPATREQWQQFITNAQNQP